MKKTIPRILITCLLIYAVVMTAGFRACQSNKTAIRSAIEASYRLPAATNDLIAKVTEARDKNIITLDQSKKFGEILSRVAKAEVVYVGMVKALQNAINTTGATDPGEVANLRNFFDLSIVEPFLSVLEIAKLLTGDQAQLILVAITAAKLLIRKIASGIQSTKAAELTSNFSVLRSAENYG